MDAMDKIKKSAEALGVLLEVPAFVDSEKGFTNEKVITWENGDQIKCVVYWAEGAFKYEAILGQVDPKTNQLAFITGPIASTISLESLVEQVDLYLNQVVEPERAKYVEPEVVQADVVEPVDPDDSVVVVDPEINVEPEIVVLDPSDDELIDAYQALNQEYQQLLLDPDHDTEMVREMSEKMKSLENKLREREIRPKDLLV